MAIEIKPQLPGRSQTLSPPGSETAPGGSETVKSPSVATDSLSALLSRTSGATITAKVLAVVQATEELRQQLTLSHSAEGDRQPPPAVTRLLQSPQLQLLKLQVQNQILTTFTDQTLKPGDNLQLRLDSSRRLTIVSGKEETSAPASKVIPSEAPGKLVADSLRVALPRQQPLQQVFAALLKFIQLPAATQHQLGTHQLAKASLQLLRQLPTLPQLSQPQSLKTALRNSGLVLEQRLAQLAPTVNQAEGARENRTAPGTAPAHKTAYQTPTSQALLPPKPGFNANQSHNRPLSSKPAVDTPPATGDLKAGLLKLLGVLPDQPRPGAGQPPETMVSLLSRVPVGEDNHQRLLQLLQSLPTKSSAELGSRELHMQLTLLLHQQLLAGLAKIQMQQLQSLGHQQNQPDSPQPTQNLNIELPVRLGQETSSLQLQIEDDWVEQPSASGSSEKVRQWEVLLSFELPSLGEFHAHLKVIHDSVSARLWAERAETLKAAKARLNELQQQLQNQGIKVTKLECFQGKPPGRQNPIGYSLIDITT